MKIQGNFKRRSPSPRENSTKRARVIHRRSQNMRVHPYNKSRQVSSNGSLSDQRLGQAGALKPAKVRKELGESGGQKQIRTKKGDTRPTVDQFRKAEVLHQGRRQGDARSVPPLQARCENGETSPLKEVRGRGGSQGKTSGGPGGGTSYLSRARIARKDG